MLKLLTTLNGKLFWKKIHFRCVTIWSDYNKSNAFYKKKSYITDFWDDDSFYPTKILPVYSLSSLLRQTYLESPVSLDFACFYFLNKSWFFLLLHTAHFHKNIILLLPVSETLRFIHYVFLLNFKQIITLFYNMSII